MTPGVLAAAAATLNAPPGPGPSAVPPADGAVVNLTSTLVVAGLYAVGTYLLLQRALMRVVMGVALLSHGTNLLLLLVGGRSGRPAMTGAVTPAAMSDPLPQGMALTSIVITFALTTFLLAIVYRAFTLLGNAEVRDDVEDHRLHALEERLEAQHAHLPHPHVPSAHLPHRHAAQPRATRPGGAGHPGGAAAGLEGTSPEDTSPEGAGPGGIGPDGTGPGGIR